MNGAADTQVGYKDLDQARTFHADIKMFVAS